MVLQFSSAKKFEHLAGATGFRQANPHCIERETNLKRIPLQGEGKKLNGCLKGIPDRNKRFALPAPALARNPQTGSADFSPRVVDKQREPGITSPAHFHQPSGLSARVIYSENRFQIFNCYAATQVSARLRKRSSLTKSSLEIFVQGWMRIFCGAPGFRWKKLSENFASALSNSSHAQSAGFSD